MRNLFCVVFQRMIKTYNTVVYTHYESIYHYEIIFTITGSDLSARVTKKIN